MSPEHTGFTLRAAIAKSASLGRLLEPLTPSFEGRLDRGTSLVAEFYDSDLSSVSLGQLFNGANAAAVRSSSGTWEVIQFATAKEISPQAWTLGCLLRGQLGTGDAMATGAETGADIVILDDAVQAAGLVANERGLRLNWRVGPAASDFSSDDFSSFAGTGGLRSLTPFAPVHVRATRVGEDIVFTWIRRSRIGGDGWDQGEVPLHEEREEYRLDVLGAGDAVLRSRTTSEPRWLYPASAIAADFGAMPAEIEVAVRQFSGAVGWGTPARRCLKLS